MSDKTVETLLYCIKQIIKPATIIIFEIYKKVSGMNYKHPTVNHSEHFIELDSVIDEE